ncbi:MAG: nickel-responsive transcriptional regulator NikR [Rhodoferax sp.]|nr:nickel-responsive transcriptional regulator NikR [Rhodoferax sp.]
MQRFTISLDDALAAEFDQLIAARGYINRSEAVRDLLRERLGSAAIDAERARYCVANVSYIYDHHEHSVSSRVQDLQHEHHDLVVSSMHTHLDHDHCLETVVLRGSITAVRACSQQLVALRGVRHGHVHLVPLASETRSHQHSHSPDKAHRHLKPLS